MRRGVIATIGALLLSSVGAAAPQKTTDADLAGLWIGKMDWTPVGDAAGGDIGLPVQLTLQVHPDGGLSGELQVKGVAESRWRVRVTSADRVEAIRTSAVSCNGKGGQSETRFRGKIATQKGRHQLVLEGKNVPCPPMNGYFRTKYTLELQ